MKEMIQPRQVKEYFEQFLFTLHHFPDGVRMIRRERLWVGFWKYGWVSRLLLFIALLAGVKFLSMLVSWWNTTDVSNPISMASSLGSFFQRVAVEEYQFFFSGGMKFLMLILLEVVIFHVSRRSLEILTGVSSKADFNAFVTAQTRMIKVSIYSWVMVLVAGILLGVAFGIFGFLSFLKTPLLFLIQTYFLGFAVVDNYSEQFGMNIKESMEYMKQYLGVGLGIGLSLQLLFLFPVVGTILGPFLAAVTATIVMYELADLHKRPRDQKGAETDLIVE